MTKKAKQPILGTILVIEDDLENLTMLTILLQELGYATRSTGKILPAFEMLRKGDIDLILTDIDLPGLDGISFARKLQKYPQFKHIPVIAMTGHLEKYFKQTALRGGCSAFLEKPIDTKLLEKTISEILPNKALTPKAAE